MGAGNLSVTAALGCRLFLQPHAGTGSVQYLAGQKPGSARFLVLCDRLCSLPGQHLQRFADWRTHTVHIPVRDSHSAGCDCPRAGRHVHDYGTIPVDVIDLSSCWIFALMFALDISVRTDPVSQCQFLSLQTKQCRRNQAALFSPQAAA